VWTKCKTKPISCDFAARTRVARQNKANLGLGDGRVAALLAMTRADTGGSEGRRSGPCRAVAGRLRSGLEG
jgi:hypothetical protein